MLSYSTVGSRREPDVGETAGMKKLDKELIDPSIEPTSEKAHRFVRATISAVPTIGGPALEVFNAIIQSPIEKRRDQWMLEVTDKINDLIEKNILSIDDLENNENFITTLIHASSVAIRQHKDEKLKALKNTVFNSINTSIDQEIQKIFINFIDSFTTLHITILKLYQSPVSRIEYLTEHQHLDSENIFKVEGMYPNINPNVLEYVTRDLRDKSLLCKGYVLVGAPPREPEKETTKFGDDFLSFIEKA